MLELIDINYVIDNKHILKNINLKISKNDFVVISGPNGSGKSTLAKIIMGIITPTSGKIIFDGYDVTDMDITERSKLGITFTFQTPVIFKGIKTKDLLTFSSSRYITLEKSKEYLSKVGLCAKDYFDRDVDSSLSGGELKRIEIATALAKESKLILFDEPEAGIDLWSFDKLLSAFNKLKKEKICTMIISHQEKIMKIANRILILNNGKIYKNGSYKQVKKYLKGKDICKGDCHE